MAALVSIGGFDFPEPSTYNATTSTIVDSARNVQGRVSIILNKKECSSEHSLIFLLYLINTSHPYLQVLQV